MLMLSTLTFSNFFGAQTTVNGYTGLNIGDSLLYNVNTEHSGWNNHSLYVENENSPEWSNKHNNYWEGTGKEVHSFTISDVYTDYAYVNHVFTFYPTSNYWYDENYHYDYATNSWIFDGSYSDTFDKMGNWSDYFEQDFLNTYSPTLNLDILYDFSNAVYVESFTKNYTINGYTFELNISHYRYEDSWTASWNDWFYDLEVSVDDSGSHSTDYFIDDDTGFLIEAKSYDYYESYRWAYNYSDELQSYIELDDFYCWEDIFEWNLFECNNGYYPVTDADLPFIKGGNQWLSLDNVSTLDIELDLYDSSDNMTLEVYLHDFDDVYFTENWELIDTFTNLSNGLFTYHLNTSILEYQGPYFIHNLEFVLYETNNSNHNTTWHIDLEDNRIIIPDWPSWYEGSDYIVLNEWEEHWEEYQVYSDTWWAVEIYRISDDPMNPEWWWDCYNGYGNSSFWLYLPPEPAGIYEYEIVFWDTSGEYINTTVTVEVTGEAPPPDDTTPPTIEGEEPPIYVKKGDSKTLDYKIYDENPGHVMVKQNDTVIIDEDMSGTEHHIYIDLSTLDIGVYIFSIDAWDAFDNHNTWDIEVHITEDGQAPTDDTNDTGTNTLNLDAPNFLVIGLGILSFTALTAIVKRKK